jgi:phage terminase large subunit-like protein
MHESLERFRNDIVDPKSGLTHDGDGLAETHLKNAIMRGRAGKTYILGKASHNQKIDITMASTLAHEAVNDAIAGDDLKKRKRPQVSTTFYGF